MAENIACKYCNSQNTIKFGNYESKSGVETQRYFCKDCKRKFVPNTLPKMKTPMNEIASALNQYYGGAPLDAIQNNLNQQYGKYLSEPGIYKWIVRFTKEAIIKAKDFKPEVGDVWIADETGINVGGRNVWFWDIIDKKTRYLLASHVSLNRTTEDAQILIEKAIGRAGKVPETIITDKLRAYIDGIDLASEGKVKHIQSKPFTFENSTNVIERFHGTLKQRTEVIHHFNNLETAQLLTEGWLIHYNFFKEHESLDNESPVKHMGVAMPFNNWNDIVKHSEANTSSTFQFAYPKPQHKLRTEKQRRASYARKAVRKSYAKKKQVRELTIGIITFKGK